MEIQGHFETSYFQYLFIHLVVGVAFSFYLKTLYTFFLAVFKKHFGKSLVRRE